MKTSRLSDRLPKVQSMERRIFLKQSLSIGALSLLAGCEITSDERVQEVLEGIAESFLFPTHFGKNLDALYDCMTDLVHKSGSQPGFVVVLEQLPDNPRFDREAREQLLDVFRDAADFWAERRIPFRCFYSFQ